MYTFREASNKDLFSSPLGSSLTMKKPLSVYRNGVGYLLTYMPLETKNFV
jgi:hypothetical protein